jgi:hypothetical protein
MLSEAGLIEAQRVTQRRICEINESNDRVKSERLNTALFKTKKII